MTAAAPYVGLAPFAEADADRFFGRDAERKRIVANLQASRFTLLHARSGVGKSSLLRAGVVARLAAAPGSRLVPVIFSSWSGDPNVELPRALGGGDGLEDALERRSSSEDGTLLIILDQFEEFFQYHQGRPEGERFADELARCVQRTDLRAHFLVSIREDAYSRLGDEFKGRLPNVYANYLRLDDLDERGARAAIEEPLTTGDGTGWIEPALVAQILHDVQRDDAANGGGRYEAAHLQYVLRRLWEEEAARGSPGLRLATLESLGGSKAIFERHFDEAVAGLGAAEQDALARAFRFLVTSGGTKRAESVTQLAELTGAPAPTLERAVEHLRQARVLAPVAAEGETRYELAHDLLAEAALDWRRQREKESELRRLRRTIAWLGLLAAVLAGLIVWALVQRATAQRQADRAEAQALVARSADRLSVDPERSIALALDAWELAATPEAEDALRRALAASLVRERLDLGASWRGALSGDGRVVVSEGPGGSAVWHGLDARTPSVRLPGDAAVLSADGAVVAVTTARGAAVAPSDGSGRTVPLDGVGAPALNGDGSLVAAIDREGGVRVIDSRTGRTLARHPRAGMSAAAVAFDPSSHDGRVVESDCRGEQMRVWAWERGTRATLRGGRPGSPARIPTGGESLCSLAVSPDGRRAVQSHVIGGASLWDLARRRRVGPELAAGTAVRDLAWSADGERFAVAAGKVAAVRDRSGRALASTPAQVDFLNSVAFHPRDGDLLVTSSRDGVARVWESGAAGALAELRGHTDEVGDAVFTADGRSVVTVSPDGTARSWGVAQGETIKHRDWVLDAAFSPDGDRVATAAADGTARITPLDGGRPVAIRPYFPLQTATAIAFDPSGRRVAVVGGHDADNGHIVVADAATGAIRQELLPAGQAVRSAAFSPDGRWLVTTAVGVAPALWRVADFAIAGDNHPTAQLALPEGAAVVGAEYSPDGRSIVTAANDGVARVYDAVTREETMRLESPGLLAGATFSPDGGRILTYGSDFTARIWHAATGRLLTTLRGHASWISRGDFSPDGRSVVTGSPDQTTRVWDARAGRLLSTQRMHGDAVNSVAYGPDGRRILSASDDRTARLYACATCAGVDALVRLAAERIVSPAG